VEEEVKFACQRLDLDPLSLLSFSLSVAFELSKAHKKPLFLFGSLSQTFEFPFFVTLEERERGEKEREGSGRRGGCYFRLSTAANFGRFDSRRPNERGRGRRRERRKRRSGGQFTIESFAERVKERKREKHREAERETREKESK